MLTLWAVASVSLVAACGGGGDDAGAGPAATLATPTTAERSTTSTTLSVEAQVEAAYLKSWDVYTDAMRTFDTSKLADVYVGEALRARIAEVNGLKAANTPGRMEVEHDLIVQLLDDGGAVVKDSYINHSVLLDAETQQPTEHDPNERLNREYGLRREGGTWKVWFVLVVR